MAEMVMRQKRGRKERLLDARRPLMPRGTGAWLHAAAGTAGRAAPCFLLATAELLGMPSGLSVAYGASLAALDRPVMPAILGTAAAMLLRLVSGLDPRWEMLISLALLWTARLVVFGRGNAVMMGYVAMLLLPMAVRGSLAPTAGEMLQAWGGAAVGALSGPLIYRGLRALTDQSRDGTPARIDTLEDRLCTGYLAALLICGGARLMLLGVNVGMLLASFIVLLVAGSWGAGAGCTAGMAAGLVMSLRGMPLLLSVALAMGGFLAGVAQPTGRRWMCGAGFLMGALMAMLISGTAGLGCGLGAAAAAALMMGMPGRAQERTQEFMQRFRTGQTVSGDAYAACMLAAWEKTIDAMAMAVPLPVEKQSPHDGSWWEEKLCDGCPERGSCGCMRTEAAAERAETVWDCREAEEHIWQDALELLRGLGCQRLYHLMQGMEYLRQEEAARQKSIRRACHQRDMLITHLTAMAGAARRFAMLSSGENWWDAMVAGRIRQELSEAASPVRLSWVRRVNGRLQSAFELRQITGARKQAEELAALVEAVVGAPMEVSRVDGERVQLAECPPLRPVWGSSCAAVTSPEQGDVCGDTAWCGLLQDGRFMAALSDGMGHGERAALASRQTVELLRLCLDAGYTRSQTLTAVNGMMLLSSHGERFTTVDLLTMDLWTGQASLDKLGAAGSWLFQAGELRQLTGDALPLGILENIESRECSFRLGDGDAVVLLTDGVEEAFVTRSALREAVEIALEEDTPEASAACLMEAAYQTGGLQRSDDQSVAVIRIRSARFTDA